MITQPDRDVHNLLNRLFAIGQSLQTAVGAQALLGLGSAGAETARMDAYSDLDFFVIVAPGYKAAFLDDLAWLSRIEPIAYAFANTADGYKLLFADGIFCEFAIMEPAELAQAVFAAEKIIWQSAEFDSTLLHPRQATPRQIDVDWLVGEAITNLGMVHF